MSYSLNEVEAMARKAARGAGYSWGMAHNAARATRWLCWHGLDGCRALAAFLSEGDLVGQPGPQRVAPQLWQATARDVGPLVVGTGMLDRVDILAEGRAAVVQVRAPILLVPFTAATAKRLRTTATIEWDGLQVISDGKQTSFDGEMQALNAPVAETLSIWRGGIVATPLKTVWRATPHSKDWATLAALAARTYAPATEESRRSGAGAGLTDND